ncbi:MAG TPA: cytochrome P460 family protein, partial [Lacipirellula sp.]
MLLLAALCAAASASENAVESRGAPSQLPPPSSMSTPEFEKLLFDFLNGREYQRLGWLTDKCVRDTGPYIDGKYYGTHPAVKIYYSPEIIEWLEDGKRRAIPDGAMIIKEQFEPPAARYEGLDDEQLFEHLSSWTVMVKDSAGSHDGWFWSNPERGKPPANNHEYPFDPPVSGFGLYCVRCHASTETDGETNEYTFASLRNVEGFPGQPLLFRVDDSWREPTEKSAAAEADTAVAVNLDNIKRDGSHPRCTGAEHPELCQPRLNQQFLQLFPSIAPRPRDQVQKLPPVTHDWVVRQPASTRRAQPFVTSNQCMNCHAGLLEPFGPTMFVPTGANREYGAEGVHLSPYGEWRWTPMGLSGRDPIFYAQLESEIELLRQDFADRPAEFEKLSGEVVKTCLSCHGAMAKHQFDLDHDGDQSFGLEHVMRPSTDAEATGVDDWRYGALARDGVSCTVCHHMQPREQPADDHRHYLEFYLENSITGNLHLGNPDELHGPFKDDEIAPYAMEHALGFKPRHNPYIKSSQLCGTCHVVNLPIVDRPEEHDGDESQLIAAEKNAHFKGFHHHLEQATYLEWLNSAYQNELGTPGPDAKTCQDCHMSRDYRNERLDLELDHIETRMAVIQDNTYPDAENLADHKDLEIRRRTEGYARHNFRGLNVFMLEMFNQFDDVLGVRKFDFMTGSKLDIPHAMDDFVRQAREEVADIAVDARMEEGELVATVDIRNKVGHRFPSGVGFRRAFIEFLVIEEAAGGEDRIVWSSGRTNELGVLVDDEGQPLPCEFFNVEPNTNKQAFQPHHEVITSPGQVQIYETLLWGSNHQFTTSFVHGCETVKDNRLLPRGWSEKGPGPALNGEFLRATYPCPTTRKDPRYGDGSGSDEIVY